MRTLCQFSFAVFAIVGFVPKIGGQDASDNQEGLARKNLAVSGQVIGGIKAAPGQFPWQVMLMKENDFYCGGSLIHQGWVMTAAHCISPGKYSVVIGSLTKDTFEKGRIKMDLPFENIFVHPDYDENTNFNDIALMKLPMPLVLPKNGGLINKIRLPNASERKSTLVGYPALSSGWGRDSASNPDSYSHNLMYIAETILPNSNCADFFEEPNLPFAVICADVENGKATCSGDSGGPLVIMGKDKRYVLVGVNSFGHKDCIPGPEAFTRVGPFVSWVKEITGLNL